ncbi:RDD family protein [bacterium]|nr:RDD family protein [bacterium]
MGKIENESEQVTCKQHPDEKTIWQCDDCGVKMCKKCTSIGFKYKIYCPECIKKIDTTADKLVYPAGVGKRIGAVVFDIVLLAIINIFLFIVPIFYFNPMLTVTMFTVSFIIFVLYFTVFTWKMGQTPGKMAMEIEVIKEGAPSVGIFNAFLRFFLDNLIFLIFVVSIISFYSSLASGMGFDHIGSLNEFFTEFNRYGLTTSTKLVLWILAALKMLDCVIIVFNKKRLSLHDIWANTRVILSI